MDKFNRKTRNRDELTRRGNNVSQLSEPVVQKRNKQLKIIKPVDNDTKHLINPYVNMFFTGSSGAYTNNMDMVYADVIRNKKHKVSSLIYNLVYHGGKDAINICDKFPELINVKSRVEGYGSIHPLNAAIIAHNIPVFIHLLRLGSFIPVRDYIMYGYDDEGSFQYADALLQYASPQNLKRLANVGYSYKHIAPYYLMIKYYKSTNEQILKTKAALMPQELKGAIINFGLLTEDYFKQS
jgi:hypothetical protein